MTEQFHRRAGFQHAMKPQRITDRATAKLVRIDRLTELAEREPLSIWSELLDIELATTSVPERTNTCEVR
jgi:hypothetical protein